MTAPPLPGQRRTTAERTITEADIVQFAALTRDFSRLHTDASYAARSVFGQRVGHGLLGLSMAEGLLARTGDWRGMVGAWEWEFAGPFFAGDTLSAEAEAVAISPFAGSVLVIETVVVRKGAEIIQRGRHAVAIAPNADLPAWTARVMREPFPEFSSVELSDPEPPPPSTADKSVLDETGVFFEDLAVGDAFTTPAMTVEAYDAAAFLGMVGDLGPWFHDRALATRAGLRDVPVPPLLGLTLVEGLKYAMAPDRGVGIPMASLSWLWAHRGPVLPGSTLRVEARVRGKKASRSKTDRGVIAQDLALCDEHGTVAEHGEHRQMFRRRPVG